MRFAWGRAPRPSKPSPSSAAALIPPLLLKLFLHEHQFAVFDFEIFHVAWKLELIALLGELFLQHFIDQRRGHREIANLNLSGIEGGVTIFGAEMSGESEIDVFASDLGEKLTANDVSIHG